MTYTFNPPLWNVTLTHDEVINAQSVADFAALNAPNLVTEAIAAELAVWRVIDWLGGNNGVSLTGTIGQPGILPLPANLSIYGLLLAGINNLPAGVPALIGAVILCNPLLGLIGWIQIITNAWPFGPNKGDLRADQGGIGDNEPMTLITNGDGTVTFLTHVGYLSLDDIPGHDHENLGNLVNGRGANITDAEKWYLEKHPQYGATHKAIALKSARNNLYLTNWPNVGNRLSAEGQNAEINQALFLDYIEGGRYVVLRASQNEPPTVTTYFSVAG